MSEAPPPPIVDRDPHVTPRAYVTGDIPPIGGRIKDRPEDFLVDEIPAYQPSGEGEHLYFLIQKRGLSTLEMVRLLATHFGVPPGDIGYAGLKDKQAITRQVVSIRLPGKSATDFSMIQSDKLAVLWTDRHANKIRSGHLKGNRFSIRVRGVSFTDVRHAHRVLERLEQVGVPNRVGEQRFGLLRNNHLIGRALILRDFQGALDEMLGPNPEFPAQNAEGRRLYREGRYADAILHFPKAARTESLALRALARGDKPQRVVYAMDPTVVKFFISAFQSAIFNAVLDERLAAGSFGTTLPGDLAFKHENGSIFAIDDAVHADPSTHERARRLEISPTGPMWQGRMMRAGGEIDRVERAALERVGVTLADLEAFTARAPQLIEGARRPFRVPLIAPQAEGGQDEHGPYVRVAFELPRGAFATAVLPEIMKGPLHASPEAPAEEEIEEGRS